MHERLDIATVGRLASKRRHPIAQWGAEDGESA
jgi:hypothetical protein